MEFTERWLVTATAGLNLGATSNNATPARKLHLVLGGLDLFPTSTSFLTACPPNYSLLGRGLWWLLRLHLRNPVQWDQDDWLQDRRLKNSLLLLLMGNAGAIVVDEPSVCWRQWVEKLDSLLLPLPLILLLMTKIGHAELV